MPADFETRASYAYMHGELQGASERLAYEINKLLDLLPAEDRYGFLADQARKSVDRYEMIVRNQQRRRVALAAK